MENIFHIPYLVRKKIEINLVGVTPEMSKAFNDYLMKFLNDNNITALVSEGKTFFIKKDFKNEQS